MTNVSVTGNTSEASVGRIGVVALNSDFDDERDVSNNIFSDTSVSGAASDGVACLFGTGEVTMSYSNLYGNATGADSEDCDSSGWSNMVAVDPSYTDTSSTDPELWDLTLATGSGLIDAGDPSISDDDGSTSDIGAYGGPSGSDW